MVLIGFGENLDPRLYRAWSVEYDEYWFSAKGSKRLYKPPSR